MVRRQQRAGLRGESRGRGAVGSQEGRNCQRVQGNKGDLKHRGRNSIGKKSSRKSSRQNFTSKSYNKKIKLDFRDDFRDEFRDYFFQLNWAPDPDPDF